MSTTIRLSENAVAALRFEIKGWKPKDAGRRLPAYEELVAAGIMEAVPGSENEFRFTEVGMACREAVLERETQRIERERHAPPDVSGLSDPARALLRRVASGEKVGVTDANRPLFRELAAARVVTLGHTFALGPESDYRFTYHGWRQRLELAGLRAKHSA